MIKDKENRSYNEQLYYSGDLPKIRIVGEADRDGNSGGSKVIIPPPLDYDEMMKSIPYGELITADYIKGYLAEKYHADYTCPVSSRKFIILAAYASVERGVDETPYWRTLKKDGEINAKYPKGIEDQKRLLEMEGHTIIRKVKRYYVEDYAEKLHKFPIG